MKKVVTSCCSRFHIFDQASQLEKKGLLNHIIHCHPQSHLKRFGINKNKSINNIYLGSLNYLGRYIPNYINHKLQKYVTVKTDLFIKNAISSIKIKPDILIGLSSFLEKTIEYCNSHNIFSIVDHGSLHPNFEKKIIIEECKKISVDYNEFVAPDWQIKRMKSEFSNSKKIIVLSNIAKKSMIKEGVLESKIKVLNCGVDQDYFKKIDTKKFDEFSIVYCGSLSPRKGVHNLIESFKLANIINSKLIIIGAKSNSAEYENYLRSKSTNKVEFLGSVKQSNLTNLLSKCHLFILPSIADGFGLVVLQAISMGLPVIVSSNVGAADIIKKYGGGHIYKYNDVNELAEKIIYFYKSNKETKKHLDLKQVIDNNTWESYGNRLYDFIEKI